MLDGLLGAGDLDFEGIVVLLEVSLGVGHTAEGRLGLCDLSVEVILAVLVGILLVLTPAACGCATKRCIYID